MNTMELKAQMIRKNKNADQLCAAIGICRSSWWRKVSGKSEFTQSEINSIRRELDLDDQQTKCIFFSDDVS